jgi:hypothetical protein
MAGRRAGSTSLEARLAALQRSAGNAAVVRWVEGVEGEGASGQPAGLPVAVSAKAVPVEGGRDSSNGQEAGGALRPTKLQAESSQLSVQRAVTGDSDQQLASAYNQMVMSSATFRELDQQVSAIQPIRLVDSSHTGGGIYYLITNHEIHAPIDTPEPELRERLIWEMHNALNRGSAMSTRALNHRFPPGSEDARSREPHYTALRALAFEWDEWSRLLESNVRALRTNFEMGGADDAWQHAFRPQSLTVGQTENVNGSGIRVGQNVGSPGLHLFNPRQPQSWVHFSNYLAAQRTRHTVRYDPNAARNDWIGILILHAARQDHTNQLSYNPQRVGQFLGDPSRTVIHDAGNPFHNTDLVWAAAVLEAEQRQYG